MIKVRQQSWQQSGSSGTPNLPFLPRTTQHHTINPYNRSQSGSRSALQHSKQGGLACSACKLCCLQTLLQLLLFASHRRSQSLQRNTSLLQQFITATIKQMTRNCGPKQLIQWPKYENALIGQIRNVGGAISAANHQTNAQQHNSQT